MTFYCAECGGEISPENVTIDVGDCADDGLVFLTTDHEEVAP